MSLLTSEERIFRDEDMYLGVLPAPDAEEEDDDEDASIAHGDELVENGLDKEEHKILFPLEWDTHASAKKLIATNERITNAFIRIRAVNAKTAMWPPGSNQRERADPHRGYLMKCNMYDNPKLSFISSAAPENHVPHIKLVSDIGKLQIFSTGKFLLNSQPTPYRAASALLTLMAWSERFADFKDITHSWYRGFCVDNHVFTGKLRHKLREDVRFDPRVKQYLTDEEIKEVRKKREMEKKLLAAAKNNKTEIPPPPMLSQPPKKRRKKSKNQSKGATSIVLQGKSHNSVAMMYTNGTIGSITGIVSIEHLRDMLLYIEELYMDYRDLELPLTDS